MIDLPIRHILFPYDFSTQGQLAAPYVRAYASRFGARVTILGARDYGQSGTPEELYDAYGISAKHVAEAARALANA